MTISLSTIQEAAAEEIYYSCLDDLQGSRKYTDCLADAATMLSPGCRRLGIETVAEFGGLGQPVVPESVAAQLRGKIYQKGLTVRFEDKDCLVTFLMIGPPQPFQGETFNDQIEEFSVDVGKQIPAKCQIGLLTLVDAARIDLSK
jgi:hypothetical protein